MYYPTVASAADCGTLLFLMEALVFDACLISYCTQVLTHCVGIMAPGKAPAGHFSILYFAAASTFTGKTSEDLPAPVKAGGLFALLENKYPGIKDKVLSSCALTVNLEYVDVNEEDAEQQIDEGDEVAIIPPVSSG